MPRAVKLSFHPLSPAEAVQALLRTVPAHKHPQALERAVARLEQRHTGKSKSPNAPAESRR
jgi:hypothetical protein